MFNQQRHNIQHQNLSGSMSVEIIIPIAAVIILLLIFAWSIKVLKVSIKTLLAIAGILVILQVTLGIDSQQIWQETIKLVNQLQELIFNYMSF